MPTKRPRSTCTECSLHRQKCDRNIPCGRCVKRVVSEKCTLTWPDGKYDTRIHRAYPKKPPALSSHEVLVDLDTGETFGSNAKRLDYSFKPFLAPRLRNSRIANSHGFGFNLNPAGPEAFLQMLLPGITSV
ncbi:hypothetical protein G647_05669 [Cladophialophora carrionii CBS 160.54]|uniref:Zn(2)-C6 fungal-type domain-containing protein n=1 Tax=Cladophialophora carrionii CBS 160.54 TaxID=1279043 RepID=V9DD53_9EURO|nr:uncharacterized protein G647_05669 [Cladophialophora carrionii CBS 160.54]ETI23862.1 hypothetical protein G647_05669 [Cladophialophora carrionii CBS 160.54]